MMVDTLMELSELPFGNIQLEYPMTQCGNMYTPIT
jgi:hypothetical protein